MPTRPILAETRALLALAWPVALTSLNWTILSITDIVFVGLTGTEEVAAFGASRAITLVTLVGGIAWLSGVLVHAARADGAGERARTGAVLREGLVLAAVLGFAGLAVLGLFAAPLLAAIGVAPPLIAPAAQVVRVLALCFPVQLVSVAASFFLEGVSRPRRVMTVQLATLPVNALLAWAWSGGHLGFPAWGAVGAAAATAATSALGAAGMLASAWGAGRTCGVRDVSIGAWRAALPGAAALARFGAVPALASALELGGFSVLIALSTELGPATAHAFQIVFSVHNITFSTALGLASAAGVRVGNAVGAGDPRAARLRTTIAVVLAAIASGMLALLIALSRGPIVAAFPGTADVHRLALAMLPLWAPFILFDSVQAVLVYALRSLGDQVTAGVNSVAAFFVVTGGAGWLLVAHGAGPIGLVWASGAGMVAATVLHGARFVWVSARLSPRVRPRSSAAARAR